MRNSVLKLSFVVASMLCGVASPLSAAGSSFHEFRCLIGAGTLDNHGCSHELVIKKGRGDAYTLQFLENGHASESISGLQCAVAAATGNIECGCLTLEREVWYPGTADEHEEYSITSDDPSCGWDREIRAEDGHNLKYWWNCQLTK
jgi:hypothetical protein